MFKSISTTWQILKDSWGVLLHDKELILLPILGVIISGIVLAVAGVVAFALASAESGWVPYAIAAAIVVYPVTFVILFFQAALVAGAMQRLRGGDPTLGSSLAMAGRSAWNIFLWAVIVATITIIINVIKDQARKGGGAGSIIAAIGLGIVVAIWEFISFFTIPVIVMERQGPISGLKRSWAIVKKTWGKQITASFGFGLIYFVAILPGVLLGAGFYFVHPIAGFSIGGVLLLLLLGFVSILATVFKAALYNYAVGAEGGAVVSGKTSEEAKPGYKAYSADTVWGEKQGYKSFTADSLRNAYRPK